MKKRAMAILLAAAVAATALMGCAKSDSAKKTEGTKATTTTEDEELTATITVWSPQEDQSTDSGSWLQTMCEQFQKEHPKWDLTFKYAVCPESDARTTVGQDPENAADVYMYANDHLPSLIAAKALAKLGGDTAEYVKKSNSQEIVDTVTVDGDIYGIPFTSNTWFMYYDKSVFTEDDVKSLDTMLTKGKVAFPVDNSWTVPAFFLGNGCTLFGEDGTDEAAGVDFGGEKAVEATDYIIDMAANSNFSNDKDGSALSGMRDGSVKAMFSGSWSYDAIKEILGDNMGVVQLPTAKIGGEDVQLKSFAGSKAIGVNPNSKNMQVSVALAKYLGGPEAQKAHYETRNIIPCNTEILADETISKDPLVKAQTDTVQNTSIMQPFVSKMDNFWKPMENFGRSILTKEVTHENASAMVEKLNESANTSVAE